MSERAQGGDQPHPPGATAILLVLLGGFVVGGLLSGWLFLSNVREIMSGQSSGARGPISIIESVPIRVPGFDSPAVPKPAAKPAVDATAVALTPTVTPVAEDPLPIWDGKDRVTILLLGIDQREGEQVPTRSDTMILVTMDPINRTAGMLSIPRDLWVPMPPYAANKINVAHFLGELEKEGSGPAFARRTIQYNIGTPIHYTARVDFKGFERLVDAIDGITVDVDRAMLDNEYPNEKYGISRLYIPAGPQHMNGITALRYARSRHADSDFGRNQRQQKVLQAARDQVLTLNMVPKLPQMFSILSGAITTDIPFLDLIALANLGRSIKTDAITSRRIDAALLDDVNGDETVLVPNRDRIRPVVQEVFYDPALRRENARIEVLNGTSRDGLATSTRTALQSYGMTVVKADSAPRFDYRETIIVDNTGSKRATVTRLRDLLRLPATAVRTGAAGSSTADVTIIIGADFRGVQ